ncbi:MAG: hypothetical protein U1E29_16450 [Coriobacteriia bacterium]|nr:hypothetical protein [Coriobacteriia bacterium]
MMQNSSPPHSTTEGFAIAEIAGRDSVAAAVAAVAERGFTSLLPTIAFTGTETGDPDAPLRAVATLQGLLGDRCEVLEPVYLQEPELWSAMNARYAGVLGERYGLCSPCLACHLHLHLLRVPLSWESGGAPVIAGERDTHDGRVKLSQTTGSIDSAVRVLAYAGIELLQPIRHASGEEVAALVGASWDEGAGQLECLLSGNYAAADGSVTFDADAYTRYLHEFFEPLGLAVVDAWRAQRGGGPSPQWHSIVVEVLEASGHAPR